MAWGEVLTQLSVRVGVSLYACLYKFLLRGRIQWPFQNSAIILNHSAISFSSELILHLHCRGDGGGGVWQIQGISRVYWYEATALCDKEITLPERLRIDLKQKINGIAVKIRRSSSAFFWVPFVSLYSNSTLSSTGNPFVSTFKGSLPAESFVVYCIAFPCSVAHCRITLWSR